MKLQKISKAEKLRNQFYKMPKWLFDGEFSKLSNNAKILYTLLADRNELSIANDFVDSEGYIFQYFTRVEAQGILNVSKQTAVNTFKELVCAGLIIDVRQGMNKANMIYLTEPTFESEATIEDAGSLKFGLPKNRLPEVKKLDLNKTKENKTDKEEEEEKGIFQNHDEALVFAKAFLEAKIKHQENYKRACELIEVFIEDMKSLKKTSIKAYCMKIIFEHDKEPALEQEQPKQPKQKRTYPKKNTRTEAMPLYDNEPIQRTPEEEQAELARIKELMADMF